MISSNTGLPGEATLEFSTRKILDELTELSQISTFRPHGLMGILYWYALYPIHAFVLSR